MDALNEKRYFDMISCHYQGLIFNMTHEKWVKLIRIKSLENHRLV